MAKNGVFEVFKAENWFLVEESIKNEAKMVF
jgi:hypothetical protein